MDWFLKALSAFLILGSAFAASPALAQCAVPNVITNGEVADATEVMENFDAIAACTNDAVTRSGIPQTGTIAVFTGEEAIDSGDLTGDVSTSGGTVTTLAPTGVTPGNYTLVDITVDAKGRVTAISSGTLPGTGGAGWTELTLTNPDAETGDTSGWTQVGGGFTAATNPSGHTMTPFQGTYSFVAAPNANPKMYQTVDLSAYATQIDAGELFAMVEAYADDTYDPGEQPYVYLDFLDASDDLISKLITSAPAPNIGSNVWRFLSVDGRVPPLTRSIRVSVWAKRAEGTNNNVAFDLIRAFIRGN